MRKGREYKEKKMKEVGRSSKDSSSYSSNR